MNGEHFKLLSEFVSPTYLNQAVGSRNSASGKITELLTQRRIPQTGWSADMIEMFIREVSLWDSNNFPSKGCVGEREGRCVSDLVRRRHWGLTHGIGRSGDVNAEQPKAAGSSFLLNLTKCLVHDALKNIFGISQLPREVVVLPIATGMSLMMGMTAASQLNPTRKHVIWSRIDQKSCIKSMTADPSLIVDVVEQVVSTQSNTLETDLSSINQLITQLGHDNIHSIVLTTSTFAPRSPDNIPAVSVVCKEYNIPLIVNNAYGLQCTKCVHLINEALRVGRVDLVVQSTDKTFLVPVGGSVIFGPLAGTVNKIYPGRASLGPILDLLITLLEVGRDGLENLLSDRKSNSEYLKQQLEGVSEITVLKNNKNSISLAITGEHITSSIGSQLFLRNISGARVFTRTDKISQIDLRVALKNFGGHQDKPLADTYLNAACAIGTTREEIDLFIKRLGGLLQKH
jgi:O-phospho-L-seryl-tRNASec:L-selenocysteinyl-tRNA synthase